MDKELTPKQAKRLAKAQRNQQRFEERQAEQQEREQAPATEQDIKALKRALEQR